MQTLRDELGQQREAEVAEQGQKYESEFQKKQEHLLELEMLNVENNARIQELHGKHEALMENHESLQSQHEALRHTHSSEINRLEEEKRQRVDQQDFLSKKIAVLQEKVCLQYLSGLSALRLG